MTIRAAWRACCSAGLLLALVLASPRAGAMAPLLSAQTRLAIPAQPLPDALMALGRQADVQILAAGGAVEGRRSPGVRGALTLAQALDRLLDGTGLDYEVIGARTVVVRRSAFAPAFTFRSGLRGAKPSVPIVGALDTVRVSAVVPADLGFKADATRGATRTDTDLAELPQSISVVTRDLMDSQQAFEVADVVRHVAGVDYVDGYGGPPLFRIRGFNAGNGLTDGMPNGVARIEDLPPLIGVERVEVLKGPEAILGEASVDNNFGGAVNIVTKRPQVEPVRRMAVSTGRYDGTRLGFDFAGALDAQRRLAYRLVAEGNDAHRTAQGYRGRRGGYLAPSIAWRSGGTRLLLGGEYIDNRVPVPDHVVLLGDSLAASSPFDVLPGNTGDHARFRTRRVYYMAEQALGEDWSLRSRGQYVSQHDSGQAWAFVHADETGRADAEARAYRYSDAFYTLQNELAGHFGEGALRHELLLGFDYARTRTGSGSGTGTAAGASRLTVSSPHAFDLMAGGDLPSARSPGLSIDLVRPLGGSWSTQKGVFVQDQVSVGESWNLLAALRRTTYELRSTGGGAAGGSGVAVRFQRHRLPGRLAAGRGWSPAGALGVAPARGGRALRAVRPACAAERGRLSHPARPQRGPGLARPAVLRRARAGPDQPWRGSGVRGPAVARAGSFRQLHRRAHPQPRWQPADRGAAAAGQPLGQLPLPARVAAGVERGRRHLRAQPQPGTRRGRYLFRHSGAGQRRCRHHLPCRPLAGDAGREEPVRAHVVRRGRRAVFRAAARRAGGTAQRGRRSVVVRPEGPSSASGEGALGNAPAARQPVSAPGMSR
jgi:iron complex outermembrane receptor protein